MDMNKHFIDDGGNQCPYCNHYSMFSMEPKFGDSFCISSFNTKTGAIYSDSVLAFTANICNNCGNIQLQAMPLNN